MKVKEHGIYIIKDAFFDLVNDKNMKANHNENRPHFFCLRDPYNEDLLWMIPMSSRIEKYRKVIKTREQEGKKCDILHIVKLPNGKESVFCIQDMFPITKNFLLREYTIGDNHMVIVNDHVTKIIAKKSKVILNMIKRDVAFTPKHIDSKRVIDLLKKYGYL